jgi:hypothetical protein
LKTNWYEVLSLQGLAVLEMSGLFQPMYVHRKTCFELAMPDIAGRYG